MKEFGKIELEDRLMALSIQQGHKGLLDVASVVQMLELRDERIRLLKDQVRVQRKYEGVA